MDKSKTVALKTFVETGGVRLIESLAEEIKEAVKEVKYVSDPYELAYRMGKRDGSLEMLDQITEELKSIGYVEFR